MTKYHIGDRKIQQIAEELNIIAPAGRKPNNITQREIDFVVAYRQKFNVGIRRTYDAAIHRGLSTSERNIRKIF